MFKSNTGLSNLRPEKIVVIVGLDMEKHKILVFGTKVFGRFAPEISSELYSVDFLPFPSGEWEKAPRMSNYSIIIMDYSAFEIEGSLYEDAQEIFEKQMFEALDNGSTVCFLHYDEDVPRYNEYNDEHGYMSKEDIKILLKQQIGFRFLDRFPIKPERAEQPAHYFRISRTEFKNFVDKWGASKNAFIWYGKGSFSDFILKVKSYALGFRLDFRKGRLIYLPCQRNFSNDDDMEEMLRTLIDNLITYLTRLRKEIPDWAIKPLFDREKLLNRELKKVEQALTEAEEKIKPYANAKSLAFASEYELQDKLPEFLKHNFGLAIEKIETYNEDFWILDSTGKKVAICEVKSYVKGFKKSGVYAIHNHREHYELDESFPAILFVNQNLNAAGWKKKTLTISPQDYQVGTSNNVLITRVEDILFMWDAFKEKKIKKSEVFKILTGSKGWLQFKPDHSHEIKE